MISVSRWSKRAVVEPWSSKRRACVRRRSERDWVMDMGVLDGVSGSEVLFALKKV